MGNAEMQQLKSVTCHDPGCKEKVDVLCFSCKTPFCKTHGCPNPCLPCWHQLPTAECLVCSKRFDASYKYLEVDQKHNPFQFSRCHICHQFNECKNCTEKMKKENKSNECAFHENSTTCTSCRKSQQMKHCQYCQKSFCCELPNAQHPVVCRHCKNTIHFGCNTRKCDTCQELFHQKCLRSLGHNTLCEPCYKMKITCPICLKPDVSVQHNTVKKVWCRKCGRGICNTCFLFLLCKYSEQNTGTCTAIQSYCTAIQSYCCECAQVPIVSCRWCPNNVDTFVCENHHLSPPPACGVCRIRDPVLDMRLWEKNNKKETKGHTDTTTKETKRNELETHIVLRRFECQRCKPASDTKHQMYSCCFHTTSECLANTKLSYCVTCDSVSCRDHLVEYPCCFCQKRHCSTSCLLLCKGRKKLSRLLLDYFVEPCQITSFFEFIMSKQQQRHENRGKYSKSIAPSVNSDPNIKDDEADENDDDDTEMESKEEEKEEVESKEEEEEQEEQEAEYKEHEV